jgi:hypothetical protein
MAVGAGRTVRPPGDLVLSPRLRLAARGVDGLSPLIAGREVIVRAGRLGTTGWC